MYPGTKVNWYDESGVQATPIESIDNKALFLLASSFDKGPEEMKRVDGESFYNLYGSTMSFERHGQAAITAAAIIDAGGELLVKRVVANDATLANVVFLATVTSSTVEDDTEPGPEEGNPDDDEPDGTEPTSVSSVDELVAALADDDVTNIELDADITDAVGVIVTSGEKTINLNGHNIIAADNTEEDNYGIKVGEGAKVTIEGEGSVYGGSGAPNNVAVWCCDDSEIVIDGGTYDVGLNADGEANSTIYAESGNITIYDGDFSNSGSASIGATGANAYVLDIKDNSGAVIECYGGTFHNQNPADGDDKDTETGATFVAEGYEVEDAGDGTYVVVASVQPGSIKPLADDTADGDTNSTGDVDDDDDSEVEVTSGVTIKWSAVSIENCYSFEEAVEQANALYDEDAGVYPVLLVTDNGRGESSKAFKLAANNELSVTLGKVFYTASTYEGITRTEYTTGTINSCIYRDKNYGVEEWTMEQVKLNSDAYIYNQFLAKVADALGTDVDTVDSYDLFTGLTVKGLAVDGLTIDDESIDLAADYGVELSGGSNGEFGKAPVNTDPWTQALIDFYDGSFSDEIYDLDEYKIAFVPDCAYPWDVKEAIAQLVTFREDCVFLRDMLFEVNNYASAVVTLDNFKTNNKFITNYLTYYQIYDPATKRRIKVTMIYDLCKCLVAQYNIGIHSPQAGIANGYILESAIEGTINYTPRITPAVNQKQMLDDLRLNYATFFEGQCIVQSLYTSQEAFTQLSYLNNVLAIQEVVRSVRTSCPKKRYTFIEDHDFSEYAEHVNNVLKGFSSNFDTLKFEYTKDTLLANQKIFYASIRFAFKDWAQSEIFDVYAINNSDLDSTTTN